MNPIEVPLCSLTVNVFIQSLSLFPFKPPVIVYLPSPPTLFSPSPSPHPPFCLSPSSISLLEIGNYGVVFLGIFSHVFLILSLVVADFRLSGSLLPLSYTPAPTSSESYVSIICNLHLSRSPHYPHLWCSVQTTRQT